jgi:site-specific DNA-methyltransferase (adenine-specific)
MIAKEQITLKINEIKPYEKNARKNDEAVPVVMESIKQCEYIAPIIIDEHNIILAGHTRFKALKRLKYKEIEVLRVYGLTEEQKRKYRLLDNKTNEIAQWDFDLLPDELDGLDFGELELDWGINLESEDEHEIIEDDVPEIDEQAEPITKLGDIWQLGRHRLMCGDSTDKAMVEKLMNGNKADMVFTDPPYGVSYTGGLQFKNGQVEKNNREMIKNDDIDIYEDVFRILSEFSNGACYVWFADTKAATLYNAAEKYGEIHALIIWVKNGGYGALNANYKQKHEPCLYWKPKNVKLNFCGATTETTVWEINKDGVNEYHPTQKPVALPVKAISNHDAKTVLDIFGGSGSTLIACEQLGRVCFTMELDPKYCDVIIKRWETLTGKKAELVNE